jgi:geranylgeranyl pyrophosphate synthase
MTHDLAGPSPFRRGWPSVRVSRQERTRVFPGDERISRAIDTLTHGVTIRRAPRDVWPWLVQMGAGSRGGSTA